jgi:glycosyltransferase involved in cell wall biosynthesis
MRPLVAIIGTRGYPSFYGGFETAVRVLAPYLIEDGWDVVVYGRPGATSEDPSAADLRVKTRTTRGLETKSLSTLSYGLTATVDAAIRKPDVALVMNVANGYWLPLLRARGIPSLVNVDGIEWDRAKWGRAAKAIFRGGAFMTARSASRLVYDSVEIGRRWKTDYGVDGEFIAYGGNEPSALPLEQGLSHRDYILMVARFVPENTVVEFMEAAETLSRRWKVVVVGSTGYGGDLDNKMRKLDSEHENILWLGHVSDDDRLFSLWQHAGAYFHGHSVGGTNPALVQAMACSAPIVARDTVYNREVLGPDAIFCEPTPAAIVHKISALMESPELQEETSSRALARSRAEYTWDLICSKYSAALRGLTSARPL